MAIYWLRCGGPQAGGVPSTILNNDKLSRILVRRRASFASTVLRDEASLRVLELGDGDCLELTSG